VIYTIALNCLRDYARRSKLERDAHQRTDTSKHEASDAAWERVADHDVVHRALGALDPGEREVVALRYGADLTLRDIATVTGLPNTTVNGRLYSGLRKLRSALEPELAPSRHARGA